MNPTEAEIRKVMEDTGMDYLQAYHHLQQRYQLQEMVNKQNR